MRQRMQLTDPPSRLQICRAAAAGAGHDGRVATGWQPAAAPVAAAAGESAHRAAWRPRNLRQQGKRSAGMGKGRHGEGLERGQMVQPSVREGDACPWHACVGQEPAATRQALTAERQGGGRMPPQRQGPR